MRKYKAQRMPLFILCSHWWRQANIYRKTKSHISFRLFAAITRNIINIVRSYPYFKIYADQTYDILKKRHKLH